MLRAILRKHMRDTISGLETESMMTVDFEMPEIENLMRSGGNGESGYECVEMVGVEVVDSLSPVVLLRDVANSPVDLVNDGEVCVRIDERVWKDVQASSR